MANENLIKWANRAKLSICLFCKNQNLYKECEAFENYHEFIHSTNVKTYNNKETVESCKKFKLYNE